MNCYDCIHYEVCKVVMKYGELLSKLNDDLFIENTNSKGEPFLKAFYDVLADCCRYKFQEVVE